METDRRDGQKLSSVVVFCCNATFLLSSPLAVISLGKKRR